MASVWELLKDLLPAEAAVEAAPLPFLRRALGEAPRGPVLAIGLPDDLVDALTSPERPITAVRWPSSLVPQPAGSGALVSRGKLPGRGGSCAAVLTMGAFETADDPNELARAIARVLRADGVVAGLTSSLEPALEPVARTLPVVGLRLVLESSGLAMASVAPGPDVETALVERQRGRHGWPTAGVMSAGNRDIVIWGENTGRSVAQVRHRMLQFCAGYAWTAIPARTPTAWLSRARNAPAAAPAKPAGPAAPAAMRRFMLEVPQGDARRDLLIEAPASGYIARELAATGLRGYEPHSIAAMLAAADLAPEGAVYDVGANVGVFALVAGASTSREVVAFEPMPGLAATARAACTGNQLDRVSVEEIALAAESGRATFYASAQSDASNSLNPRHRAHSDSFEVVLETLDAYVARTGVVPAVIKIDTETTEPDVIRGALATFAEHRPWIICEVLGSGRPDEVYALMEPLGYAYHWITPDQRWEAADRPVPDPAAQHFNWLFAPVPLDDAFWQRLDSWRARVAACGSRTL